MRPGMRSAFMTSLLVIAIVLLWEAAVRTFAIPVIVLPPPSAIAAHIYANFDKLLGHTWTTTYEIAIGFAAGAALGIAMALAMVELPALRGTLYPLVIGYPQYLLKLLRMTGGKILAKRE